MKTPNLESNNKKSISEELEANVSRSKTKKLTDLTRLLGNRGSWSTRTLVQIRLILILNRKGISEMRRDEDLHKNLGKRIKSDRTWSQGWAHHGITVQGEKKKRSDEVLLEDKYSPAASERRRDRTKSCLKINTVLPHLTALSCA